MSPTSRSRFTPARAEPFTSLHLDTKAAIERRWPGRHVIGRRTTNPPPALADALRTGRLTLRANAVVSHVVVDRATGRASGVAFVDRRTGRAQEVRGRVVVLCASAVESTRILLNSETPDGGRGLGNSSGVLGRYLVDHVYLSGLVGRRRARPPRRPSDGWSHLYLPQLVNVSSASREREFSRGYGIQLALSGDAVHAYVFGEMLPRAENHVTLDDHARDRWGIPAVRIDCAHGDNERKMVEHMAEQTREMMRALDAEIEKPAELRPAGASIHEVGTARMGQRPEGLGGRRLLPLVGREEPVRRRRRVVPVRRACRTPPSPCWRSPLAAPSSSSGRSAGASYDRCVPVAAWSSGRAAGIQR